ncbi:hypothetical protein D3C75_856620 [compost metagenome]
MLMPLHMPVSAVRASSRTEAARVRPVNPAATKTAKKAIQQFRANSLGCSVIQAKANGQLRRVKASERNTIRKGSSSRLARFRTKRKQGKSTAFPARFSRLPLLASLGVLWEWVMPILSCHYRL